MFKFKDIEKQLGRSAFDFITKESNGKVIRDFLKVLAGKGGFLSDYKVRDAIGRELLVEGLGHKINYKARPLT
jgi:hypothetical protein